jgi:hypothetical protein
MELPTQLARGSLATLLMVLAIGVAPTGAQQPDPEAVLDHFLCYNGGWAAPPRSAVISDQFVSDQPVQVLNGFMFCNPVEKTLDGETTPIQHPEAHLACYTITHEAVPSRTVSLLNQFGESSGGTFQRTLSPFCVPSLKSELGPPLGDPPEDVLSHFRCYTLLSVSVDPVPPPRTVGVRDQFGPTQVEVSTPWAPSFVCNPATKVVDGVTHPALYAFAHLACYSLAPQASATRTIFIRNQFGDASAALQQPTLLCLPSLKDGGPPPPPRVAQHFKGFRAVGGAASRELVTLIDQFGTEQVRLGAVRQLLTPVEKRRTGRAPEPIQRPAEHLKCYRISGPDAGRTVRVTNQFTESTELTVGAPTDLCAPATKVLEGEPGPPPADLNHYKCYAVSRTPAVAENVDLVDQFGTERVRVQRPSRLCNPVEKRRAGRDPEPPPHPTEHLVCYQMRELGDPFVPRSVFTRDQFRTETLSIDEPSRLCVPSEKLELGGG